MMEDSQHPHSTVTMPEISLPPVAGPSTGMGIFNTGHHSHSVAEVRFSPVLVLQFWLQFGFQF